MTTLEATKAVSGTAILSTIDTCVSVSTYRDEISSIKDYVENRLAEPEVRLDQRTTLNTNGQNIEVIYFDKGKRTGCKTVLPNIRSVEIYNENTIKITFKNGDVQTATAQGGDEFSFETGAMICLMKEMLGKEASQILGKLIDYTAKVFNDAEKERALKEFEATEQAEAKKRQRARQEKRWAKKLAKARENRIQEMAEAIARANEMLKTKK
jgi:hypothetical protein